MNCYNVKVIEYLQGIQVRIYSELIGKKDIIDEFYDIESVYKKEKKEDEYKLKIEKFEQIELEDYFNEKTQNEIDRVKAHERSLYCSRNRTINNIYEIARSNEWEYFLTLTFNPDKVDSFNFDEVTKKLSQWINNFKKKYCPDLKYILVPELHKSGRFHFHGLLSNIGSAKLIDSGQRDNGNIIYNLGNYKLGFSTVTKINYLEKACSYIGKYITKDLCSVSFGKKRYWISKNLDKPSVTTYVMSPAEIDTFLESYSDKITFTKRVDCINYDMHTSYIEIEK